MLTAAGANAGVLRGLPCLLGVVTGMGAMMFLEPARARDLVLGSALVLRALHWGAVAFQWINPKSWLVSASAAGTFLSADGGSAIVQSAFLGGLFIAGALLALSIVLIG